MLFLAESSKRLAETDFPFLKLKMKIFGGGRVEQPPSRGSSLPVGFSRGSSLPIGFSRSAGFSLEAA